MISLTMTIIALARKGWWSYVQIEASERCLLWMAPYRTHLTALSPMKKRCSLSVCFFLVAFNLHHYLESLSFAGKRRILISRQGWEGRHGDGWWAWLANRKTRRPDFLRATASASINVLLTFTLSSNYPNFNGHRPLLRPSNYAFIKIWIDVISACWKLWYQSTSTQK